jgi:hypothetical protein
METKTRKQNGSGTLEANVGAVLRTAQDNLRHCREDCEEAVRRSPGPSLFAAMAVGYFLRQLPIAALISGLVRLVFVLLKPAVLLFSAAKLYETIQHQARVAETTKGAKPSSAGGF